MPYSRADQTFLNSLFCCVEAQIFMLQEQTNLVLIGKNVLIAMVPILIDKDVFKPNYNDLKFMILNRDEITFVPTYQHC